MLATAAATLFLTFAGTKPGTYSERWLCDLWAGAQCHVTSCEKDAKARCMAVSKSCKKTSRRASVAESRADTMSTCARALLKSKCGDPKPAACEGVSGS